jgi:hypothetical protein
MAYEAKKPEGNKIGLAALIASIGIPLAQLMVGYFEQHTTQMNNAMLEKERRRLEITKLFLDNYIGKKTDVQLATIQIMKALDPTFFISIEEGLKETTNSDSVKASIRKATVEAATEISQTVSNHKNVKVTKVLSSKELETKAIEALKKGDAKNAQKFFDKAHAEYPIYTTVMPSSGSFEKDVKRMNKQMDKQMDKLMKKKMDSLEKATGVEWKRLD